MADLPTPRFKIGDTIWYGNFTTEMAAFRAAFEKAGGKVEINVIRPTGPRPKKGAA